jgi:hypothetical protein
MEKSLSPDGLGILQTKLLKLWWTIYKRVTPFEEVLKVRRPRIKRD